MGTIKNETTQEQKDAAAEAAPEDRVETEKPENVATVPGGTEVKDEDKPENPAESDSDDEADAE